MKTLFVIIAFQIFQWSYSFASDTTTIKINKKSCNYSIKISPEWDTIPKDSTRVKFGKEVIDAAFYCRGNKNLFQGEYILCRFMPTANNLCQFSFAKITEEIKQSSNITNKIQGKNGIKIITDTFFANKINFSFQITGKVLSEKGEKKFYQTIVPAKFGYVMATAFQDANISVKNCKISNSDLSECLVIDDHFKYSEPPSKFNLTIWHVIISFVIGLVVYLSIQYASNIKQLLIKK